jgi:S-DNA-T family DNA segregation ATPase FtsK/SpoIIIE
MRSSRIDERGWLPPTRDRVTTGDGETRQVRGYLTAEIKDAVDRLTGDQEIVGESAPL